MLWGGSDWGAMQDPLKQKPPCRSGPDELIPTQILLGRSVSEDEKQTEGSQGAFVWRTFCRFCLGSGFSLALVGCVCTGNKINVTPALFNLSLLFLLPLSPFPYFKISLKEIGKGREILDHVPD